MIVTTDFTREDLEKLVQHMHKMLIVKHEQLGSIYGSIEHEEDEFMQRLTDVAVKGLNAGTGNFYDTVRAESIPMHRQFVPGLDQWRKP